MSADDNITLYPNTIKTSFLPALHTTTNQQNHQKHPIIFHDLRQICCEKSNPPAKISQNRLCCVLENVLSPEECKTLEKSSLEFHNFEKDEKGAFLTAPGARSQFSVYDCGLSELLFERIREYLPEELDGGKLYGVYKRVSYARYAPGQVGFAHMDYRHKLSDLIVSRISFTTYLNDDYEGGELSFVSELQLDGGFKGEYLKKKSKIGSSVLFYQGVPEFAHMPHKILSGYKSIMRADIMYKFPTKEMADAGR